MPHGHWVLRILVAPEDYPDDLFDGEDYSIDCCLTTAYLGFQYADDKTVWFLVRTPHKQEEN